MRTQTPESVPEAAEALRAATEQEEPLRLRGGGTKLEWGAPADAGRAISTEKLDALVEHNRDDLTAVLQAGVKLVDAQAAFAEAGQMLAIDPPLGAGSRATIGGVIATGDSGPLRHRYRAPRDLVLGITVALADGTVASAGGKVIKNVAGYDLAKLFTGSFGTLGLIVEVVVRLQPLPATRIALVAEADDPAALQNAALALSHAPLEPEALDIAWQDHAGRVLVALAGAAPEDRARAASVLVEQAGLDAVVVEDDGDLWNEQRNRQRAIDGVVVRVSGRQSQLATIARVADRVGAGLVGRAALGLSWLRIDERDEDGLVAAIEELRAELRDRDVVVLDAPETVRRKIDVWGTVDEGALGLMRRVKARFDPAGVCNRGIFIGGM